MASFALRPLLPAQKVRVTALHQYGPSRPYLPPRYPVDGSLADRLYIGTATGVIQIYSFHPVSSGDRGDGVPVVKLLKSHPLAKKAIDQVGVLGGSDQLAVLSGQ